MVYGTKPMQARSNDPYFNQITGNDFARGPALQPKPTAQAAGPMGGGLGALANYLSQPRPELVALGANIAARQTPRGMAQFGQHVQRNQLGQGVSDYLSAGGNDALSKLALRNPNAAIALYGRGGQQRPTAKDASGRLRYLDQDRGYVFNDVDMGGSPVERERRKEALAAESGESKAYRTEDDIKEYGVVRAGYDKLRAAAQMGTGAGDIALITNFMKMLDPGSVVREGEFWTAASAGGVARQYMNYFKRFTRGQYLSDTERQQFVDMGDALHNATANAAGEVNEIYRERAGRYDVKPMYVRDPQRYEALTLDIDDGSTVDTIPIYDPKTDAFIVPGK